MKRNAKQTGPGGRLRLGLLLATAAAFLLVPVAMASAAEPVIVNFEGEGAGTVEGSGELDGVPHLKCHWNGKEIDEGIPGPGECTVEATEGEFTGILAEAIADEGSDFAGWTVQSGIAVGCEENGEGAVEGELCGVITFGGPIEITAKFILEPEEYALNLTTSGTGSGSFSCDTGSGPEACQAEYVEGTEVTVTANPDTGSELGTVSGTGAAAACAASPCTVTMTEAGSIDAEFNIETFTFGTEVIGEGTVECNSEPCASEYDYGTEIEITATPNSVEFILADLSGTGNAAECTESLCEKFTITEASSIKAEFKTAAFKDTHEIKTVHGEVPETTTLNGEGCKDVDLGTFIPGETADYSETCTVVLTSTGAETKFTASDPSAENTGHLVQGSYFLPSALEVMAEDSQENGAGPGLTPLSPVTLLTFGVPIASDTTTLTFNQHIDAEDGLHTGVYSKLILLTLEQTA